jgi:hypothetical protein
MVDWNPQPLKQFRVWLDAHVGEVDYLKRIPSFVFDLAPEQQMVLLDGLMGGDGTPTDWRSRGAGGLQTTSRGLADDVQRLATVCGWRSTVGLVRRKRPRDGERPCWQVSLSCRPEKIVKCRTRVRYRGDVWCFSMPSGTMVTRRCGRVLVSGNSDHDNKRLLTTHEAQVRFLTDLLLQANVFLLVYDDGDDGKVKLGLLDHDSVENAVRDDDARLRILYYFTRARKRTWDPKQHCYKVSQDRKIERYYEEYQNLRDAKADDEAGLRKEPLPQIPDSIVGRGRVLHVAINRTLEQAFGVPEIARVVRFLTSYNDLVRARIDMAKAAASIIMRRKWKGAAGTLQGLAQRSLLGGGLSATAMELDRLAHHAGPAGVLDEMEDVEHEAFSLNTGSSGAQQDAQLVLSQLSAAWGLPGSYLGAPGAVALSTATSLELRVLKVIESLQQVVEDTMRAVNDRAIERALETRNLSKWRPMTDEEQQREQQKAAEQQRAGMNGNGAVPAQQAAPLLMLDDEDEEPPVGMVERDLSYQLAMPSPLRRAMGDLITALSNIAKTFDPNNTNLELSKLLLGIALGEGLEVEDPGAAVERVFPEGYVDPAVQASMAPQLPPGSFGAVPPPVGPDGQRHPNPDNPYGAPMTAQPPEMVMQQAADLLSDGRLVVLHQRGGEPIPRALQEAMLRRLRQAPSRPQAQRSGEQRAQQESDRADLVLADALAQALALVNG